MKIKFKQQWSTLSPVSTKLKPEGLKMLFQISINYNISWCSSWTKAMLHVCNKLWMFLLNRKFVLDTLNQLQLFLDPQNQFNPALFIEVPVLSQESGRSWVCVLGVSTLPLSMIFYWILELSLQCDICSLFFILIQYTVVQSLKRRKLKRKK